MARAIWIAVLIAALLSMPAPARATSVTLGLGGGSLSITGPTSVSLGSAATGSSTVSAHLGTVTVSDTRGAVAGTWTATVTSSSFTTGGGTANETIAASSIFYWSGPATSTSGIGVFTPGQLLALNEVSLSSSRTAFSATGITGNNSVSWDPTIDIHLPAAAVAGTYTGSITHSVA